MHGLSTLNRLLGKKNKEGQSNISMTNALIARLLYMLRALNSFMPRLSQHFFSLSFAINQYLVQHQT
jgi:hypothetical protein